jgi:hypothetical protein
MPAGRPVELPPQREERLHVPTTSPPHALNDGHSPTVALPLEPPEPFVPVEPPEPLVPPLLDVLPPLPELPPFAEPPESSSEPPQATTAVTVTSNPVMNVSERERMLWR